MLLLLTFLIAVAFCDTLVMEVGPLDSRKEAHKLQKEVLKDFNSIVIRQFNRESGWRYRIKIEGVSESEVQSIRSLLGSYEVLVFQSEESLGSTSGPTDIDMVLKTIVRAHGDVLESGPKKFCFERTITRNDSTLKVWHEVILEADKKILDIKILEGSGIDSKLIIDNSKAMMEVKNSQMPVDMPVANQVFDLFSASQVLNKALQLSEIDFQDSKIVREDEHIYELELMILLERFRVIVDKGDYRVREIKLEVDGETISWLYDDYREIAASAIPFKVIIKQDMIVWEEINVLEFVIE